jgi:predicted metalloprotease with PDZ domain
MAMNPLPLITYTVAMPQPHTHLFHIHMDVIGTGATTEFILPSWTPGSYLVRDFARHVQEFSAVNDQDVPLSWRKQSKNSWCVETQRAERVRISYKVYANDLTVRTSHLDASHGYFNGTNLFLYVPGRTDETLALVIQPPEHSGWQVATGLEPHEFAHTVQAPNAPQPVFSFIARDYDELVDCPVECGRHRLLTFTVDDKEHRIAIWGHGNEDEARLVADTQRIVEAERDLFGNLPYRHYTFILHLADRYGGLEHRNSVTNIIDRWSFQPESSYQRFLKLQSHELFHVWNVKRIRPGVLGPFDYRQENYTRLLWAMEGVTSYYDRLILVRAGLMTPERYLDLLADEIVRLQSQPGRKLQSLEQSSFDAWIKLYRPDENSINSSISYYLKGALVILLLDLEIRYQTNGTRSFDDVLRHLYAAYPINGPGIPEDGAYLAAIETVAGKADGVYQDMFERWIEGTEELDYARGLGHVGVQLEWEHSTPGHNGDAPAWLGIQVKQEQERTLVERARSDGPAYGTGIYAGDELLALDGFRIDKDGLNARLREHCPGDTVTLTLFRRDELLHVPVVLAAAPPDTLTLTRMQKITAAQRKLFREWLPERT